MRLFRFGRRAVSTMIGGIILLVIFLGALVFMFTMTEQYDSYQSIVAAMQEQQIEMYSENILPSFPGITNGTGTLVGNSYQVSCGGVSQCNNYTILVNNLGITTRVARLYIYQTGSSCNPCIFDPATTATPNRFKVSGQTVNLGEYDHNLIFWLPSGTSLSFCTYTSGCKITVATSRGRTFSFMWPFPLNSIAGAGSGGTGLYIGPLVITFQKALITYTTASQTNPPVPIGGDDGDWALPSNTAIVIYVKIQTDINVPNNVYLTPQTVYELFRFDNPGAVNAFFIVGPITPTFCQTFIPSPNPNGYNGDLDCTLSTYNPSGNTGSVNPIAPYSSCGNTPQNYALCTGRYVIPKPTAAQLAAKERGTPVIIAFSVATATHGVPPSGQAGKISNSWTGKSVTSFLGLSYVYDDGTGPYLYGVTLPFIALCIDTCPI